MLRKIILCLSFFLVTFVYADIIEIKEIDAVRPYVTEKTLCLFDVDDTLIENPFMLGTPPWRAWVKAKISKYPTKFILFDALSLYIAQNAPYKALELSTAKLISDLQNETTVFAFTARGRSQWYTTDIAGVDRFTYEQLLSVGIDFRKTIVPRELENLEPTYFYNGIIFAKHIQKGQLFKILFKDLNYAPSDIIFVDDKLDHLQSVEAAVLEMGIPFTGFWYRRSELEHANFNPMTANIQLESLLLKNEIISDKNADQIAKTRIQEIPEIYLRKILNEIEFEQLTPMIGGTE